MWVADGAGKGIFQSFISDAVENCDGLGFGAGFGAGCGRFEPARSAERM